MMRWTTGPGSCSVTGISVPHARLLAMLPPLVGRISTGWYPGWDSWCSFSGGGAGGVVPRLDPALPVHVGVGKGALLQMTHAMPTPTTDQTNPTQPQTLALPVSGHGGSTAHDTDAGRAATSKYALACPSTWWATTPSTRSADDVPPSRRRCCVPSRCGGASSHMDDASSFSDERELLAELEDTARCTCGGEGRPPVHDFPPCAARLIKYLQVEIVSLQVLAEEALTAASAQAGLAP